MMAPSIHEHLDRTAPESRLAQRVDELLLHATDAPLEWGHPLLSTTPRPLAIRELAVRTECLTEAVREIAVEVERLSHEVLELLSAH